jgi:two-component system LytT family response regulator
VIVDDEPLARRGVRLRLRPSEDFLVQRECASGREAVKAITELKPDLVFLDIQMPGMSGLDVARAVGRHELPIVIFTTAHDQYALQAFDARAIDYLLKPLDDDRFARALSRARALIDGGSRPATLDRFWVKTCGRVVLVPVARVDWIGAEGDYARLHTGETSYLINDSLTSLEAPLFHSSFARIHRSTIVNLRRIAELRPHLNQDHVVRLTTGTELRLSRTYYRQAVERLREHTPLT